MKVLTIEYNSSRLRTIHGTERCSGLLLLPFDELNPEGTLKRKVGSYIEKCGVDTFLPESLLDEQLEYTISEFLEKQADEIECPFRITVIDKFELNNYSSGFGTIDKVMEDSDKVYYINQYGVLVATCSVNVEPGVILKLLLDNASGGSICISSIYNYLKKTRRDTNNGTFSIGNRYHSEVYITPLEGGLKYKLSKMGDYYIVNADFDIKQPLEEMSDVVKSALLNFNLDRSKYLEATFSPK